MIDNDSPMGEMNSTPLIDIMLVLLIMFVIIIPPVTHAIKIDLSIGGGWNAIDPVLNKIIILPTNEIFRNGAPVSLDQMSQFLD